MKRWSLIIWTLLPLFAVAHLRELPAADDSPRDALADQQAEAPSTDTSKRKESETAEQKAAQQEALKQSQRLAKAKARAAEKMAEKNQEELEKLARQTQRREALQHVFASRIRELTRACNLSPRQKRMLEVAGKGAVERFLADKKKEFEETYHEGHNIPTYEFRDVEHVGKGAKYTFVATDPLWTKTFKETLSDSQLQEYQRELAIRNAYRRKVTVAAIVEKFDRWLLLYSDQRQRLAKLVDDQIGIQVEDTVSGGLELGYFLYPVRRIPMQRFGEILDDDQMDIWRQNQAAFEKQQGVDLPDVGD